MTYVCELLVYGLVFFWDSKFAQRNKEISVARGKEWESGRGRAGRPHLMDNMCAERGDVAFYKVLTHCKPHSPFSPT